MFEALMGRIAGREAGRRSLPDRGFSRERVDPECATEHAQAVNCSDDRLSAHCQTASAPV